MLLPVYGTRLLRSASRASAFQPALCTPVRVVFDVSLAQQAASDKTYQNSVMTNIRNLSTLLDGQTEVGLLITAVERPS